MAPIAHGTQVGKGVLRTRPYEEKETPAVVLLLSVSAPSLRLRTGSTLRLPMEKAVTDRIILVSRGRRESAGRLVERYEHDFCLHIGQAHHALTRARLVRFVPAADGGEDFAAAVAAVEC